MHSGT